MINISDIVKKAAIGILSVSLMLTAFSGCDNSVKITTGLGKNVAFKMGNDKCSMKEILLTLIYEKNQYEKDFGKAVWDRELNGQTFEDSVKEEVRKKQTYLEALYLFAKDNGVKLTEEENKAIESASDEYIGGLSEEEKTLTEVNRDDVIQLFKKCYMADRIYDDIATSLEYEVSDEEARVMNVMYIYVESDKEKIQKAYKKVKKGTDFYSIAEKYSEEKIVQAEISRGDMIESVENEVFKLEEGDNTGIIETESGYYIIKCVKPYLEDKTEENKANILEKKQTEVFLGKFNVFMEKQEVDFNNKEWNKININDYENATSANLYDIYEKMKDELAKDKKSEK